MFKRILKGVRIRKLPEKDCVTCRDLPEFKAEFAQLLTALNADPGQGDFPGGMKRRRDARWSRLTSPDSSSTQSGWKRSAPWYNCPVFCFLLRNHRSRTFRTSCRQIKPFFSSTLTHSTILQAARFHGSCPPYDILLNCSQVHSWAVTVVISGQPHRHLVWFFDSETAAKDAATSEAI